RPRGGGPRPPPPAPRARAMAVVLRAGPDLGPGGLAALCDSDEPLLAGVASVVTSYLSDNRGDSDAALKAAERMMEVVERRPLPLLQILANSRLAELHMHADRGAEAVRHLRAALRLPQGLGNWRDIAVPSALG